MFRKIFPRIFRVYGNVHKYGRARKATDDRIYCECALRVG